MYYLPGIQLSRKVPLLLRPSLWGGLGVVCMYLPRLVGIGMYVCLYVCMYVWGWILGMGVWGGDTIEGGVAGRRPGPLILDRLHEVQTWQNIL